jgi:2-polyprenyl-6-methoxyphenol hydroxylase-like FAD-dependent oxidoreductase
VRPVIIDRHSGPAQQSRALGVQARTMEIYSAMGLASRALELGARATGANLWVQGRRTARVPLGDIGQVLSPFPFLFILGQDDNEKILGEALRAHDLAVAWNTELIALEDGADRARATLRLPDGTRHDLTAAWVAGCDGARSAVREFSGIPFLGAPYEHVFFVADTIATGPMVLDELNVYLWRAGFHLFFPMRGRDHWRVVGILPEPLRDRDDLRFEDVVPSVRTEIGDSLAFSACRWFSTYRIHHRRAARFRQGRCFLLGDAAHIHSPVGAQGMNTGLQDAYNLAWKLSLVATGRAREQLLDSYASEREPVTQRLLRTTDRAFTLIVRDDWLGALFRTRILANVVAFAMERDRFRRLAFGIIAQIGINYRGGPLGQSLSDFPKQAPRPGDRFPWMNLSFSSGGSPEDLFQRLDDTLFNLIIIGQIDALVDLGQFQDFVHVLRFDAAGSNSAVFARWNIPVPSFWLLRPDGHIGLAGARFEHAAVTRYLHDRIQLMAS